MGTVFFVLGVIAELLIIAAPLWAVLWAVLDGIGRDKHAPRKDVQ